MVKFVVYAVEKFGGAATYGAEFLGAGYSLLSFVDQMSEMQSSVTPDNLRRLKNSLHFHMACCRTSGIKLVPKNHLAMHFVSRTRGAEQTTSR